MELPGGIPDPYSLYDLAYQLHMSVQEMTTGVPGMSAHEIAVGWPTYLRARHQLMEDLKNSAP